MKIVLKKEARTLLERNKETIDHLLVDGSLDAEYVKSCGCCGPPPSPDYAVSIVYKEGDVRSKPGAGEKGDLKQETKIVPFLVDGRLHDAIEAANMSMVVFFIQRTDETGDEGTLVAKII